VNNAWRGLPLARAHVEQIFPKLTPAQIRRIAARGHMVLLSGARLAIFNLTLSLLFMKITRTQLFWFISIGALVNVAYYSAASANITVNT
jgi:hypothetical protein